MYGNELNDKNLFGHIWRYFEFSVTLYTNT